MALKIYKKTPILRNTLWFVLASLFYVFILVSFDRGTTVFSKQSFLAFMRHDWWLFPITLLILYLVSGVRKFSSLVVFVFYFLITIRLANIYFSSFDKAILLFWFTYMLLGFQMVLFYHLEASSPLFRPGFSTSMLNRDSVYTIPTRITKKGEAVGSGQLTNWGESSLFILLDSDIGFHGGDVAQFEIYHDDHIFNCEGRIYTAYDRGVGVLVLPPKEENTSLSWKYLYNIIQDKGLTPYYNRMV